MKVAILSDIHGNIDALRPVLEAAESYGVDKYLFLGDLVGYYYHPAEVYDELVSRSAVMIQGNHERMLKALVENPDLSSDLRSRFGSGLSFANEQLSQAQIDHLLSLPETCQLELDGISLFLAHGSPHDRDLYVYPDSPEQLKDRCLSVGADYVCLGHTHRKLLYAGSKGWLVNPGSVGQARDVGGLANWALLDTSERTVQQIATKYKTTQVETEAALIDPHLPFLVEVLRRQ